jgi:hypothetical protein
MIGQGVLRPGYIQPVHGVTSRTRLYRLLYAVTTPLYPVLKRVLPGQVTTTEQLGRAMIKVGRDGARPGSWRRARSTPLPRDRRPDFFGL